MCGTSAYQNDREITLALATCTCTYVHTLVCTVRSVSLRPVTIWKAKCLKFRKIPAKLCLNGRLWTQFGRRVLRFFSEFRKISISRGDFGQQRREKFPSRSWIRRGATSCSPLTSFDEINNTVVNSECGELVRGSDFPLVYSAHSTAGNLLRAPIRLTFETHLAAHVYKK